MEKLFCVTDAPFHAKGDGVTNDRAAIQSAIDTAHSAGGGTVVLDENKVFLSGGIVLKSNVTLLFSDGAVLQQSGAPEDYVKPCGDGYVPYTPHTGHNFSDTIKWSHYWYRNYPFVFVPEGSENFRICGNGTIRMMDCADPEEIMKICPIGFYRCGNFEISDVHIKNYHGYALMPFTSSNGLFRNIKISDWSYGNGDGICLMNCHDIRITGCTMFTGDDSVYIFSSYRDPRKGEWWSSDDPEPSYNIEIDHNDLRSNHCKAFGMILWGTECPDFEKVEVRNVYVHDNHIETLGVWLWNPYSDKAWLPPVTDVRFENNVIDGIETNFFETQISNLSGFRSTAQMHNGNFEQGRCFWSMKKNSDSESAGVHREKDNNYGYIDRLSKGPAALYQGLYVSDDSNCVLYAEALTSGCTCRLFVRDAETDELIAHLDFRNTQREKKLLEFRVPKSANYRIGVEGDGTSEGYAHIWDVRFSAYPAGDAQPIFDNGKLLYKYNGNLFKR